MRASALVPARMAAIVAAPVLVLPLVLAFVVPLVVAVARLAARGAIAVVVVLVAVAARLGRAVAAAVLLVLLVAAAVRVLVLRAALLRIRHVRLAVLLIGARSGLARGVVFAVLLALLGAARALPAGRVLVLRAALVGVGAGVARALLRGALVLVALRSRALVVVAEHLRALVTRAELRAVLHALLLDARVPAVRRDDSWGLRHSDLGECNSYSARGGGRYKLHGLPPDFRKCPHRAGGMPKTQGPFPPPAQFRDSKCPSTRAKGVRFGRSATRRPFLTPETPANVRQRTEAAPACRDDASDGNLLLGGGRGAARLDELRVSGLQRSARPGGFDRDRRGRRACRSEGARADVRHHCGAARRHERALPHVRRRDRGRVPGAGQSSLPALGHLRPVFGFLRVFRLALLPGAAAPLPRTRACFPAARCDPCEGASSCAPRPRRR